MSVLNLYMVLGTFIPLKNVIGYLHNSFNTQIKTEEVCSIKNWQWEEKEPVLNIEEIPNTISNGRIAYIRFGADNFENIGVYIEKKKEDYIYNFWFDIRSLLTYFPSREIMFRDALLNLGEYYKNFTIIATGEEIVCDYETSILDIMRFSHNVELWLVKEKYVHSCILRDAINIPKLESILHTGIIKPNTNHT